MPYENCVNCGKQVRVKEGDKDPTCYWCKKPARRKVQPGPEQPVGDPGGTAPSSLQEHLAKIRPLGRDRKRFYIENKNAIIADYHTLGEKATLEKYNIPKITWVKRKRATGLLVGLKVRWGLVKADSGLVTKTPVEPPAGQLPDCQSCQVQRELEALRAEYKGYRQAVKDVKAW